jgi:transposase
MTLIPPPQAAGQPERFSRHDAPGVDQVFDPLPEKQALEHAIMDRGSDSNHIRKRLHAQGVTPVIPPKKNRKAPIDYDEERYTLREKVERFFNRLKQFRRVATRYDKLGALYLAFVHLVATWSIVK